MSVNKVILLGRLAAEPESRSFPSGGSICNLRVATNMRWKDKQSGEQKESAEFHRVVLRNKLGEIAQQYLKKGSQVYIEGSIRTRKWQNQQGEDQYTTEVIGRNMTMLDSKQSSNGQESKASAGKGYDQNQSQPAENNQESQGGDYYDDDIPF